MGNLPRQTALFLQVFSCESRHLKYKYIESIYNSLVLSIRDKGMPKKESICDIIKPWVFEPYANKIKGALHIRIGKIKAINKLQTELVI